MSNEKSQATFPRFGEQDALKIKPSEIKGWLESVQDEEDLENSTADKIRRAMHLVYSTAQANDLIPRTVEANPVKHVHIATTTEYETILVTPQEAWNIICRMKPFARLLTLLIAVTGLRIGEVLALKWEHVDWRKFRIRVISKGQVWGTEVSRFEKTCCAAPAGCAPPPNLAGNNDLPRRSEFHLCLCPTQGQRTPHAQHAGRRPCPASGGKGDPHSTSPQIRFSQPQARIDLVPGGTDPRTIQDMLRWADPSILLKVYAHSRMDKRMETQAKMIEAIGLNEKLLDASYNKRG